ncbi:hypothetical protein [Peribacillus sp. SCS-155]
MYSFREHLLNLLKWPVFQQLFLNWCFAQVMHKE